MLIRLRLMKYMYTAVALVDRYYVVFNMTDVTMIWNAVDNIMIA